MALNWSGWVARLLLPVAGITRILNHKEGNIFVNTFTDTISNKIYFRLYPARFSYHTAVAWIGVLITCTYGTVDRRTVIATHALSGSIRMENTLAAKITFSGQAWVC